MQITDSGLIGIILAIFRCTAQDLKYGNKKTKKSANEFLASRWFEDLCGVFSIDKRKIEYMIRYNKVSWRDKYE